MMVLITYDVSLEVGNGAKRLRHIAKLCLDWQRVQYSVFECEIQPDQWSYLKDKLLNTYNPQVDSLRFYLLGSKFKNKVEHFGTKGVLDLFRDTIII